MNDFFASNGITVLGAKWTIKAGYPKLFPAKDSALFADAYLKQGDYSLLVHVDFHDGRYFEMPYDKRGVGKVGDHLPIDKLGVIVFEKLGRSDIAKICLMK
jgi:hypothetical protein